MALPDFCKLSLTKVVHIKNEKLNRAYLAMMTMMGICVMVLFIGSQGYLGADLMQVRLVVSLDTADIYSMNVTLQKPDQFSRLCPAGMFSATGECIGQEEVFVEQAADTSFLTTEWSVGGRTPQRVPFVDAAKLTFRCQYTVRTSAANKLNPWVYLSDKKPSQSFDSRQVETLVLGKNREVAMTFAAHEEVKLTMQQLIELAQVAAGYDSVSADLRATGAEIIAKTECLHIAGFHRMCVLEFDMVTPYAKLHTLTSDGQNVVGRSYKGLRIRGESAGAAYQVSIVSIFAWSGVALIYMSLPKKLFRYFMCVHLGHLSKIYRRVLRETFDVVFDSSAATMRLVSSTVSFSFLAHMCGSNVITRKGLRQRLGLVLESRKSVLDLEERTGLANFVFNQIQYNRAEWARKNKMSNNEHSDVMDMDVFAHAMASFDKIAFDHIVHLFDTHRRRPILERLFTPSSLNEALKSAASHELQPAMSGEIDSLEDIRKHNLELIDHNTESIQDAHAKVAELQNRVMWHSETKRDLQAIIENLESKVEELQKQMMSRSVNLLDAQTQITEWRSASEEDKKHDILMQSEVQVGNPMDDMHCFQPSPSTLTQEEYSDFLHSTSNEGAEEYTEEKAVNDEPKVDVIDHVDEQSQLWIEVFKAEARDTQAAMPASIEAARPLPRRLPDLLQAFMKQEGHTQQAMPTLTTV